MLEIQKPMAPSTLISSTRHSPYCPHLPRLKEFGYGLQAYGHSPKATFDHYGHHRSHSDQAATSGQAPSATSSSGSWQLRAVPKPTLVVPPYPTPQDSQYDQNQPNGKSEPFYNKYYSARQTKDSPPRKEIEKMPGTSGQRKGSGDVNSIATHLQIPSSINDSKGSLPEFAAQLTCLFWFEISATLSAVEQTRTPYPGPIVALVQEAKPSIGFRKWVTTILSMTQVSPNVVLLALMFIYRLKKHNPSVKGKVGSEYRLLTVALMLGNKFLDDNTYTNKTWADVSGISVQEIHVMEVEFLSNMRYSLYASKEEWDQWHVKLGRFAEYYDKASQAPAEIPHQAVILPAPRLSIAPNLPSPPISHHSSPPYVPQISPTSSAPHPLSMPALVPSTGSISPANTPVSENGPWSRKRSLEDFTLDHPAKRTMTQAPSASSSTAFAPTSLGPSLPSSSTITPVARDPSPWRLPPPQPFTARGSGPLSSPIQPADHSTPTPPRTLSSVVPSQGRPYQRAQLPSLHPTYPQASQGSLNYADHQLYSTAFAQSSQTPSPTAYHFPHHSTPTNLSPSSFVGNRDSPYRPVRAVNTLLVPPPSSSIQQAPQHVSYDQMHYQPLGRPRSEQRSGVLPLHHFHTWSDNAHQLPPQLPPPHFP